ncbi:MAG TPA: hydroxyacylglutathione hydrolase family protein [Victivallales bacterium]|nr:hydroxyacylglutathione hydrolase family protein [Victivallales bacterium]HPO91324.1 hydroxyacylglutathione hydrolase family protein [Victivallales bacterium]HRR05740.1 hydroxyacylglutathione hydrolase family protein [Victivallales bacterium]HRR28031.1 hydroxyacylglutathione hydrolase family protein [Victivallales bacterium]HRU01068.1 hydroxyacylglutathione hydrolase family protein [Victivallales bacterium]
MSEFIVKQILTGGFDNNFSYLIIEKNSLESIVIDPCGDINLIEKEIKNIPGIKAKYILLTHGHFDHISGLNDIQKFFRAKVAGHPKLPFKKDYNINDGEKIPLGSVFVEAIYTPGHTEDSITYRLSDNLGIFTGDTLFIDYIGYCKPRIMFDSLQKIKNLPDSNLIFSGHNYGAVPFRSLKEEKEKNPFLKAKSLDEFTEVLKSLS